MIGTDRSIANKRVWIVAFVVAVAAGVFWSGSRYPSLDEKAAMGGSTQLEDPLSFEASLQIQPSSSAVERVAYTTVNWIETNLEGMAFGLIVGACLLTLLSMVAVRGHRNGFINTLLGVLVGTPLGVCVNCSAPVAKGMHDGGARLETTLATMFSSPTLNVIVLTMLFSIFPLYLTVIKLSLTLLFILVIVPLLSRYAFANERVDTYDDAVCALPPQTRPPSESWLEAMRGAAGGVIKNLGYLVLRTVPLMILAGLLGAVVVTLVPLPELVDFEPGIGSILVIALVGIFLPVPVAFDVILVAVLMAAGAPMMFSMTLLFVLGIFSIYPFFIVWNTISPRVAITLTAVLMALGIAGGVMADRIHEQEIADMLQYLEEVE